MSDQEEGHYDAFTATVLSSIDADVLVSFTPDQRGAIVQAVSACRPLKNHPVDVRGVVSLFYSRYYFVFLMGRDRRVSTQRTEADRRHKTAVSWGLLFFVIALCPLILLLLIIMYILKSTLGIDLVPGRHAWEIVADWLGFGR